MTNEKEFIDFLKTAIGQKEVSLVIAKNLEELENYSSILSGEGFKKVENISNAFNTLKIYFSVDTNMSKDAYDFMVQYPTGQVEIFDKETMTSKTLSPDYDNSCIIYLVLKDNINILQKNDLDVLSNAGLVYQE